MFILTKAGDSMTVEPACDAGVLVDLLKSIIDANRIIAESNAMIARMAIDPRLLQEAADFVAEQLSVPHAV